MEFPDTDMNISLLRGGAELNSMGLTTTMGPRHAEKGPNCCSNFRAQQITEYSELKLAHKDHQIPLLTWTEELSLWFTESTKRRSQHCPSLGTGSQTGIGNP